MILSRYSPVAEGPKENFEDVISIVRRSLGFLGPQVEVFGETQTAEKVHHPSTG